MYEISLTPHGWGWVTLKIDDFKAKGSYLEDLPMKWLKSIRFSVENFTPLALNLDEEGSDVLIVSDRITVVTDNRYLDEDDDYLEDDKYADYHHRVFDCLDSRQLSKILLQEFNREEYFPSWIKWNYSYEREDLRARELMMRNLIKESLDIMEEQERRWKIQDEELRKMLEKKN